MHVIRGHNIMGGGKNTINEIKNIDLSLLIGLELKLCTLVNMGGTNRGKSK